MIGFAALAVAASATAAPKIAPQAMPSPIALAARPAPHCATPIRLDPAAYPGLKQAGRVVFQGFPLDRARRVDLDLERFEVLTEDAIILAGDAPIPRPDVVLFRGSVAGSPGSRVFLSLSPYGTNGLIDSDGDRWILSSGPHARGVNPVIYSAASLPAGAIPLRPFSCATEDLAPAALPAGGPAGPGSCGGAEIAVETSWEFTADLFDGNTAASAAYVGALFGAVSEIYNNDVATVLQVGFLRVWPDANDLWEPGSVIDLLFDFQDYWNENMDHIERHTTHFLVPAVEPGAGGVAYLSALCDPTEGYGVSGFLDGFFPYPLEDNNPQNWDVVVVAHELGHNFGAPHTHSVTPPIDQCAYGLCGNADQGTIMSYCQTCPGGVANIVLRFHERTIDESILPFLDGLACDLTFFGPQIVQQPVDAEACLGAEVTFGVVVGGAGAVTYQWRKDGADITGATGSSYTILAVALTDAGVYDVVLSGDCGDITSAPATLSVTELCDLECPLIESQPQSLVVCPDDPAEFHVAASGTAPLSYQWRKNGAPIPGATGTSYSIALVLPGHEGDYDVVVTNDCGTETSETASLDLQDCTPPCPWDMNGNGIVGADELLGVLGAWLQPVSIWDLDGGGVGITDLLLVLGHWGFCP